MLAAIYGLQALVFIFRMRWDMIAWMICKSRSATSAEISLHLGNPCLFILFAIVLLLEDGRFQLGNDTTGSVQSSVEA